MAATDPARAHRPGATPRERRITDGLRGTTLVLLGLLATLARADERVAVDGHYYLDSDQLEVWHPHASVGVDVDEETRLVASYDADVISAATVDLRTAASPRGFRETRHGVGAELTLSPEPTLRCGVGASGSFSPDFASGTIAGRLVLEDDARVHALTMSVAASYAGVGRIGDQAPSGESGGAGGVLSWTAVVSEALVLDVSAAADVAWGYLESPYRYVTVYDAFSPATVAVPESMPDQRVRGAMRVRARVAPTDEVFLRGAYRFHVDDWAVLGHTAEVGVSVEPVSALLISVDGRWVGQRAASFYLGRYETLPLVPDNRTRDRELAGASTLSLALRVDVELPLVLDGVPTFFVRGELQHARLFDTWLLPERFAGVVGVGLTLAR